MSCSAACEACKAARSKAEYAEAAYEDLRWLGIRWQEGPGAGRSDRNKTDKKIKDSGPYGPYLQSKRGAVYLNAWRKLMRGGISVSVQVLTEGAGACGGCAA